MKERSYNFRTSIDIYMKLGQITKLEKRNKERNKTKQINSNVMLANRDVIGNSILVIMANLEKMLKPD